MRNTPLRNAPKLPDLRSTRQKNIRVERSTTQVVDAVVEMRRGCPGIAGITHEPDYTAGVDTCPQPELRGLLKMGVVVAV